MKLKSINIVLLSLVSTACIVPMCVGCGGNQLRYVPAAGTVTVDGKPINRAEVVLLCDDVTVKPRPTTHDARRHRCLRPLRAQKPHARQATCRRRRRRQAPRRHHDPNSRTRCPRRHARRPRGTPRQALHIGRIANDRNPCRRGSQSPLRSERREVTRRKDGDEALIDARKRSWIRKNSAALPTQLHARHQPQPIALLRPRDHRQPMRVLFWRIDHLAPEHDIPTVDQWLPCDDQYLWRGQPLNRPKRRWPDDPLNCLRLITSPGRLLSFRHRRGHAPSKFALSASIQSSQMPK